MKKLPTTIGPFATWAELKLVLEILPIKYNHKLVAPIEEYKNTDIHGDSERVIILSHGRIHSTTPDKTTMSFKKFKHIFINKTISFKSIY